MCTLERGDVAVLDRVPREGRGQVAIDLMVEDGHGLWSDPEEAIGIKRVSVGDLIGEVG